MASLGSTPICSGTAWPSTLPIRAPTIGTIQTLLGHKTAAMAPRYAGQALDRQGARRRSSTRRSAEHVRVSLERVSCSESQLY